VRIRPNNVKAQIDAGINPSAQKREAREQQKLPAARSQLLAIREESHTQIVAAGQTFKDLFEAWVVKETIQKMRSAVDTHLASLASQAAGSLYVDQFLPVLQSIARGEKGVRGKKSTALMLLPAGQPHVRLGNEVPGRSLPLRGISLLSNVPMLYQVLEEHQEYLRNRNCRIY
jgi:hypothetical protein